MVVNEKKNKFDNDIRIRLDILPYDMIHTGLNLLEYLTFFFLSYFYRVGLFRF